jgi:hypothetical protein
MSFEFDYKAYSITPERAEAITRETNQAAPAETSGEKQARQAYEQANRHLDRVLSTKDASGHLRYSSQDRHEAEQDLKTKEREMFLAQNEGAKQRRLAGREAVKAEEARKRAEVEARQQAEQEADLKQRLRGAWAGSDAEFIAAWPGLKQEYYSRQALSQLDADRAGLAARYGGRF